MTAACFPVILGEWFGCRFYHLSYFLRDTSLATMLPVAASRHKGRYRATGRKGLHLSKVNRCEKTNHAVPDFESKRERRPMRQLRDRGKHRQSWSDKDRLPWALQTGCDIFKSRNLARPLR